MKILRNSLIVVAILSIGGYYLVEKVLPYVGIKPMRRTAADMNWALPKGLNPDSYALKTQKISLFTPDSIQLCALLVSAYRDTPLATIVLIHGISGCKETQLERAQVLAEAGYASLLLDLRAHGESEGVYCTFGVKEKNDLRVVADTLERRFPKQKLGIWGASLGGAVALQAMEVEPRYQIGIIESTFDEYEKVAMEYGAQWLFGLRSAWLTAHILEKSGEIAHFDPEMAMPVAAARQIERPVLFIHGDRDARIPMSFGKHNFEVCPAPTKKWYRVHGGGHNNLWRKEYEALKRETVGFLQQHLTP